MFSFSLLSVNGLFTFLLKSRETRDGINYGFITNDDALHFDKRAVQRHINTAKKEEERKAKEDKKLYKQLKMMENEAIKQVNKDIINGLIFEHEVKKDKKKRDISRAMDIKR